MSYEAPFAGLRVVDLSQGVAGPYAAMLLARYGADVVKVEPPEGDWARTLGRRYGDHTAFSIAANLGKRSIALDLKTDHGREAVRRLTIRADVFLESFRPGVAGRLGVAYPEISALNPRIVYLSVSGFGQSGPERDRPAVDTVLQAFTGLMSVNVGGDGVPHRVGAIVMDMATALYAFQALAVALYARRDEPRGRHIDASLMVGGAGLQTVQMVASHLEGGRARPGLTPSATFPSADGWINVTILREPDFPKLGQVLEIPAIGSDPRFATNDRRGENREALMQALNAAFRRRSSEEWAGAPPRRRHHASARERLSGLPPPSPGGGDRRHRLDGPAGRRSRTHPERARAARARPVRVPGPRPLARRHGKEILAELGLVPAPGP